MLPKPKAKGNGAAGLSGIVKRMIQKGGYDSK
jgi:hypothetical protein